MHVSPFGLHKTEASNHYLLLLVYFLQAIGNMIAMTGQRLLVVFLGSAYLLLLPTIVDAAFGSDNTAARVFVSTPVSNYPKRYVSDCMSPLSAVVTLTPDMSVDEAMGYLLDQGQTGAVVLNNKSHHSARIVGIVTAFDFLQKEAFGGSLLPMSGSAANVEKYVEAAKKICGQTVADIMTARPTTVPVTASMREAAAILTELRVQRLPVVDADGMLVGLLSSTDVMRDLRRIIRNLPASKEPLPDADAGTAEEVAEEGKATLSA
jgi:CBS domain-containing protein